MAIELIIHGLLIYIRRYGIRIVGCMANPLFRYNIMECARRRDRRRFRSG